MDFAIVKGGGIAFLSLREVKKLARGDSAEGDHRFRRERGHDSGMIPVSRKSEATLVL
jgi:hypothetical protein